MKLVINRSNFLEILSAASYFTSGKIISQTALQGICIKLTKNKIHFYSSNLNSFFHSQLEIENQKEEMYVIEGKRIVEFLSFLPGGEVEIENNDKLLFIKAGKNMGTFPLMSAQDFPLAPQVEGGEQKIEAGFFNKNLPLVLFSASSDETRPALTGVNFLSNGELSLVATDGFRLSLLRIKKEKKFPSVIIPADFLNRVLYFIKEEKDLLFSYLEKEKMIFFKIGKYDLYSRLIEGDFPPFEKVIPQNKKTTTVMDKNDFLRNIKLISIFARDLSNIVIFNIKKDEVVLMPRASEGEKNSASLEAQTEGEEQRIAFNYKFILDFLVNTNCEKIAIDILRPDAPVVFRMPEKPDFLHIIMPVRIQE